MMLSSCGMFSKMKKSDTAEQESMTEKEISSTMASIYDAMARMNKAEAKGKEKDIEKALDNAMDNIRVLVQEPLAVGDPEVRELYQSVLTAYEQYYGVSDTMLLAYGEVFDAQEELFEEMNDLRDPLSTNVMIPDTKPVTTTIPLDQNQLVEQSIRYLLRSPDKHLHHWLRRAHTYFPMIEKVFSEEGVPDEVKYLAMVESGLNPKAVSHANAVGMWQFIYSTGKAYGLQRTHWVDERMDPEKATRAAARYLKDLYAQFGDWHLAMAAYNCGPGRVARAVRRHGGNATFWDVYDALPRETRNYVPMFIAAALVVSDPGSFNVKQVQPGPRYAYDVAQVEGMIDLRMVADLSGSDVETIKALNPEIRQWSTPPSKTGYSLRLPVGSQQRFLQAYASLPPQQRQGQSEYTVRSGDTLGKIARRHDTSVAALQEINGIRGSVIHAGQTLIVPVQEGTYAGVAVSAGSGSVDYGTSNFSQTSLAANPSTDRGSVAEPATNQSSTRVRYRVRRGDNLTKIASKYGVSVSSIKGWNNLRGDRINAGQTLTLYPNGGAPATNYASNQRASSSTATNYKVRRGDNLSKIAKRHGVSVSDIRRWNNLSSDRIYSGQRLVVHASAARGGTTSGTGWVSYKVKRGDNLTKIAKRYGATAKDVKKWNSLKSDRLQVGQRLAIYVRSNL